MGWRECAIPYTKKFIAMNDVNIRCELKQFHGTSEYHKHLFPGKFPILLTDGCKYVRDACKAYWLFDAILSYQNEKVL
jgi:hypothetical protein